MATTKKAVGLTSEKFIRHFKTCTGWKCEAGMRITNELTAFATAHLGSTRNIDELHGHLLPVEGDPALSHLRGDGTMKTKEQEFVTAVDLEVVFQFGS